MPHDDQFDALRYSVEYLDCVQKQIESMREQILKNQMEEIQRKWKFDPLISGQPLFHFEMLSCLRDDILREAYPPPVPEVWFRTQARASIERTLERMSDPFCGFPDNYLTLGDILEKVTNAKVRNVLSMERREELGIDEGGTWL